MTCSPEAMELLATAITAAEDALAENPVAVDVTGNLPFADAFLIVTADNPRHLRAVASSITKEVREKLGLNARLEGDEESDWLLVDYGDVVIHIFLPEAREFYALEKLWGHSPRIGIPA